MVPGNEISLVVWISGDGPLNVDEVLDLDRFPGHWAVHGFVRLHRPGLLGLRATAGQPEGRQLPLPVTGQVADRPAAAARTGSLRYKTIQLFFFRDVLSSILLDILPQPNFSLLLFPS